MNKVSTIKKENSKTQNKQLSFQRLLVSSALNISRACELANISRSTYYLWKKNDETFSSLIDDLFESDIDNSESQLRLLINGATTTTIETKQVIDRDGIFQTLTNTKTTHHPPDTASVIFHLKTKGRDRNWNEKQSDDKTDNEFIFRIVGTKDVGRI